MSLRSSTKPQPNTTTTTTLSRYFATATSSSSSAQEDANKKKVPFYGTPRKEFDQFERTKSIPSRISLAIHHAVTAFSDPTRADAVAALGEITGTVSLQRLQKQMQNDETGRLLLKERPVISKDTIPYQRLIEEAPSSSLTEVNQDSNDITFGQAYGLFLKSHEFDPDERDEIKYIEDEELAYIMLRYRQVRYAY